MARLRHVINVIFSCDKQNSVVYSGMTNELFPSNEQEMNEQDEVLREEGRITIGSMILCSQYGWLCVEQIESTFVWASNKDGKEFGVMIEWIEEVAWLRHVINAKRVCDKQNSVVYYEHENDLSRRI